MADASDFQWLTSKEAVLLRPDALLGSNDPVDDTAELLGPDGAAPRRFSLSRIFMNLVGELLVNALDAAVNDEGVRRIKISFKDGVLEVFNDGKGIPVTLFGDTGRYLPEIIFTELNAGSNFQDKGKRFSGGRNGVGASCANMWASAFSVDIHDAERGLRYEQEFSENMSRVGAPVIKKCSGKNGHVRVLFKPDYERLGILDHEDSLLTDLVRTRAGDGALCA